jgi:hypothetical protein
VLALQSHDLPHVEVHGVQEAVGEAPQEEKGGDEGNGGPLTGGCELRHLVTMLVVEPFEGGKVGGEENEERIGGHLRMPERILRDDKYSKSSTLTNLEKQFSELAKQIEEDAE